MRSRCQRWGVCSLLICLLMAYARRIDSQTNAAADQEAQAYKLSVAVDEVILTFHAADAHGLPVNDLKVDELHFFDNGKPPRKILAFQLQQDFPIRAGILMDTSGSMGSHLAGIRAIAIQYAQKLLRQKTDQAFVMEFGRSAKILQTWSGDPVALAAGVRGVTASGGQVNGTAIFDTLMGACLYQFGKVDHAASGNFILLFSDGEDNASYTYLKDAVDTCQRSNTAIYAFSVRPEPGADSTGPAALAELAAETGGRVFHSDDSEAEIYNDLQMIEADLRNQYRVVYKAAELKHDGAFHRIELTGPDRVDRMVVRSGYYAPKR